MTAPYSNVSYAADGSTNTFAVPFPYLQKAHVSAYINGVLSAVVWPTAATVQLAVSAGSLSGKTVRIQRSTPLDAALVTFQAGGLAPGDLNIANLQTIYAVQELSDGIGALGVSLAALILHDEISISDLPVTLPASPGILWNNGGVICLS